MGQQGDAGVVVLSAVLGQAQPAPSVPGAVTAGPAESGAGGTTATQGTPTAPAGGPAPGPAGFPPIMWILILGMGVMVLMTSMTGKKQKKQREALLSGLKRNDRVQTVGGIIGTVVDLTSTEMVLRVDESSNTRIRFARSAVQQVLREGKAASADVELKPGAEPAPAR